MSAFALIRELADAFLSDLTSAFSIRNWQETFRRLWQTPLSRMLVNLLMSIPTLFLFYILLSPVVAMPLYNRLLFHPSKELVYDFDSFLGARKSDVEIRLPDKSKLHAWYFDVPDSRGVVILSHGNAGNISHRLHLIDVLVRRKLSVLAYDYEGYGKSEGSPSIENICRDGLAAYDYLIQRKEHKFAPARIIVYGESLGGGVSAYIASKRSVGGIILQSTFSSLPHVARTKMPLMRLYPQILFPRDCLDSASSLAMDHPPLLIVHGKKDHIIPYGESEILFARAREPKQLTGIEDAGHNDMYVEYKADLESAISGFLESVL